MSIIQPRRHTNIDWCLAVKEKKKPNQNKPTDWKADDISGTGKNKKDFK